MHLYLFCLGTFKNIGLKRHCAMKCTFELFRYSVYCHIRQSKQSLIGSKQMQIIFKLINKPVNQLVVKLLSYSVKIC